jgi:type II secretory pathway component PulC
VTRGLRPGLRPPWVLLGAAAVLAAVIGVEWTVLAGDAPLPAPAAQAASPPPSAAAAAAQSYDPPSIVQYAEIAARPLFLPGRRPQADDGNAAPKPAPRPPTLTVQGVVLSPDRRYAVITHGNPLKNESFREGDTVEGWHIDSIDRKRVALSQGGAKVEVAIGKPPRAQ